MILCVMRCRGRECQIVDVVVVAQLPSRCWADSTASSRGYTPDSSLYSTSVNVLDLTCVVTAGRGGCGSKGLTVFAGQGPEW